ncbi:porin family outer membrane protein [Salinisphaera sp. PC39]|uniref:outer membrane beta-barrel protein n=1 Tax=Salinisphaera sp. PC39 TaxID=1304156 RepID=UPI003341C8DB
MQGSLRLAATVLFVLPACALAAPNYDYVQATAAVIKGDAEVDDLAGVDEDFGTDGYAGEISAALGEHAFFQVDHKIVSSDDDDVDLDVDRTGMGIGLIRRSSEHVHLYGLASFERIDLDDEDGDGYSLNLGMRLTPSRSIEINPSIGYVDYGEIGDYDVSGMEYAMRVILQFTDAFGLVAAYEGVDYKIDEQGVNDDPDFDLKGQWHLGARLSF